RFLKVIEGPIAGHRVELGEHPLTIGRAPDNGLPLPDPAVSSHHARIDFYQGRYFVSDLQSSNGTYLNNGRIDQAPLNDGDILIVGQSKIQVVLR
ncbi:MAG: FHA domain-containing protein, partial [Planctomycetota bacterium]